MYQRTYDSPLGRMVMTSDGTSVTGLVFSDEGGGEDDLPVFEETARWLDTYFSGRDPGKVPSVVLEGTPFMKAVWEVLMTIPYGKTMTYGEVAGRTGPGGARAVGNAAGRNPVLILVPCHRLVPSGGGTGGYSAGRERKRALLALEG